MQFLFCPRVRGRNVKLLVLFVSLATLSLVLHFRDRLLMSDSHVIRLKPSNELQIERIYTKNELIAGPGINPHFPAEMVGRDILMSRSVDSEQFGDHDVNLVDTSDRLDSDLIDHNNDHTDKNDADHISDTETVNLGDYEIVETNTGDFDAEHGTDSQTGVKIVHVSNGLMTRTGTEQLPQGGVDRAKVQGDGMVVHGLHSDGGVTESERGHHQHTTPATATQTPKNDRVHDPVHIRIMPKNPIMPEDHPLQLTCASTAKPAPHLEFELPRMSAYLESLIRPYIRTGLTVLRFMRVDVGHQGTYLCIATDNEGRATYNSVQLRVIDRGDSPGFNRPDHHLPLLSNTQPQMQEGERIHQSEMRTEYFRRKILPLWNDKVKGLKDTHLNTALNVTALEERGKFQQIQVEKFCDSHGLGDIDLELPGESEGAPALYRHLLLNDHAKTLFCFAPKVGCTNLRVLFYIVQGLIPLAQLTRSRDSVNQDRLEAAMYMESFANRNDVQRKYALQHYFKFVMYRNPLERLLSGYRSKVQRYPLVGLKDTEPHFNWLRKHIYIHKHPEGYRQWLRGRGKKAINISFSDFIDYWLTQPQDLKFDEHFRPIFKICQPCRTRFSFYANFKNFEEDTEFLISKIGGRLEYLRDGYYTEGESTQDLLPKFYRQLSNEQKRGIIQVLEIELDFYYHLFPEENDIHKKILNISDNVPLAKPWTLV